MITPIAWLDIEHAVMWVHYNPNQLFDNVPEDIRAAHKKAEKQGYIRWVGPAEGWVITKAGRDLQCS